MIGFLQKSWQRPTLPRRYQRSTIGPAGLVYSVRNGKRNFTRGKVARKYIRAGQSRRRRDDDLKTMFNAFIDAHRPKAGGVERINKN